MEAHKKLNIMMYPRYECKTHQNRNQTVNTSRVLSFLAWDRAIENIMNRERELHEVCSLTHVC